MSPSRPRPSEGDEKIQAALELAYKYGGIDGAHHKQWVIDQMVRVLAGGQYNYWVKKYQGEVSHGEPEYEWDVGIAP